MRCSILFTLLLVSATGCGREPGLFVESNARAHIGMLAGTIGSRPIGSPENKRAREYLIDQLKQIGFSVRVQEADARRHELGLTARVANIIAVLPGERTEAVGLIAHYDSSPDAPGAADDALGVGIALETARVFAAGERRHWSLFVIITDGEESGLMGAAALVTDRDVMQRLQTYINLEAIGSSGTAILFETGPANAWLVSPWAHHAPHPRGGSYAIEIYHRLPNDTDFSIFKTRDVPGLNFAPAGDSYAYHTARDTPERLSRQTISRSGENTISILHALQDIDITQRSSENATFFDIGESMAVSYRPGLHWLISAAALCLGIIAWVRFTADAIRHDGFFRWLLALVWAWTGAVCIFGAMVGATGLLRSAQAVYHPWYARPGRFFMVLILVAVTVGWGMVRLGQWLPMRAHPTRHPSLVWTLTLPIWILLAAAALWFAPSAVYFWMLPLLAAGALLAPVPPRRNGVVRLASFLVLVVAASLWVLNTHDFLRFAVAVMGRLPMITPLVVYATLLTTAGAMVMPPLVAALAAPRPLVRPGAFTSVLLIATVTAAAAAHLAPAYTVDEPLRRHVRALQDGSAPSATWEVASVEPGLDLHPSAPSGWRPLNTAQGRPLDPAQGRGTDSTKPIDPGQGRVDTPAQPGFSVPWSRYPFPFVFRTTGPALGAAPATIGAFTVTPVANGTQMNLSVIPSEPGLTVSFILPAGIEPARTSLPGVQRLGRWTASFVAPPAEGIAWEARFHGSVTEQQLRGTHIMLTSARFPGGSGWQQLPEWLPQDTMVWSGRANWVVPVASAPSIAPVPALR